MLQFYKIKIILFIYIYMYEISGVPSYHNYQLLNNSFNQKKKNSLFKYILFIIAIILFLLILNHRLYPPPFLPSSSFLAQYSKSPYKRGVKNKCERFMKIGQERRSLSKKGEAASLS